jgi:formylmethanofuran dehydrogenase subunit E
MGAGKPPIDHDGGDAVTTEKDDYNDLPGMDECIRFHGHLCPGLVIGYKAARAALDGLKVERAEDEELFAIVETDACGADAIQVLTGCTFGKGNFIFRDLGKHAFTVGSRKSGRVLAERGETEALTEDTGRTGKR